MTFRQIKEKIEKMTPEQQDEVAWVWSYTKRAFVKVLDVGKVDEEDFEDELAITID